MLVSIDDNKTCFDDPPPSFDMAMAMPPRPTMASTSTGGSSASPGQSSSLADASASLYPIAVGAPSTYVTPSRRRTMQQQLQHMNSSTSLSSDATSSNPFGSTYAMPPPPLPSGSVASTITYPPDKPRDNTFTSTDTPTLAPASTQLSPRPEGRLPPPPSHPFSTHTSEYDSPHSPHKTTILVDHSPSSGSPTIDDDDTTPDRSSLSVIWEGCAILFTSPFFIMGYCIIAIGAIFNGIGMMMTNVGGWVKRPYDAVEEKFKARRGGGRGRRGVRELV